MTQISELTIEHLDFDFTLACEMPVNFEGDFGCPNEAVWSLTKKCGDTLISCDRCYQNKLNWIGHLTCVRCGVKAMPFEFYINVERLT